jgi:hypothetical protein
MARRKNIKELLFQRGGIIPYFNFKGRIQIGCTFMLDKQDTIKL